MEKIHNLHMFSQQGKICTMSWENSWDRKILEQPRGCFFWTWEIPKARCAPGEHGWPLARHWTETASLFAPQRLPDRLCHHQALPAPGSPQRHQALPGTHRMVLGQEQHLSPGNLGSAAGSAHRAGTAPGTFPDAWAVQDAMISMMKEEQDNRGAVRSTLEHGKLLLFKIFLQGNKSGSSNLFSLQVVGIFAVDLTEKGMQILVKQKEYHLAKYSNCCVIICLYLMESGMVW